MFSRIRAAMGEIPVVGGAKRGRAYLKTLAEDDFISEDINVFAGKYTRVGNFVVPAQQEYEWGYGSANNPENQGYLYIELIDSSGGEVTGKVQLRVSDANERKSEMVFEESEETLHGSLTDREQKVPLPNRPPKAKEDDRLQIWVKPDSDGVVALANTTILIPTTNYQLSRF